MKGTIRFDPGLFQELTSANRPLIQRLCDRSMELIQGYGYSPKLKGPGREGEWSLAFTAPAGDSNLRKHMESVRKLVTGSPFRVSASLSLEPAAEEMAAARVVRVSVLGDGIDEEGDFEDVAPLNEFPIVCRACHRRNLERIPQPYRVNRTPRQKVNQDVFQGSAGLWIVRRWVREALEKALGRDVAWGEVRCQGDGPRDEPLAWMRPRTLMPRDSWQAIRKTCKACGQPTEVRSKGRSLGKKKAEFFGLDTGYVGYPARPAAMCRAELFYGDRTDRGWGGFYEMYASGPLWAALRSLKVKGITDAAMAWTVDWENPLLTAPKPLAIAGAPAPQTAAPAREDAVLASLPWNQRDGYVYFELKTRTLALADPMLGGEDAAFFEIPKFIPGAYRLPVRAIRGTTGEGAPVDSACLLFIDAACLTEFAEALDFENWSPGKRGESMLAKASAKLGCRFALCPAVLSDPECDFQGDGGYTLDLSQLQRITKPVK